MDFSTPGSPVHHQLPEPAQTRVYQVGDAIQPSHPLSSPSPFTSGGQSIGLMYHKYMTYVASKYMATQQETC